MRQPGDDITPCCGEAVSLEDCQEAMDRLERLLDREISSYDLQDLNRHMRLCEHCTHEYDLLSRLQEILRVRLCDERCPETLKATISALIHEECEGC